MAGCSAVMPRGAMEKQSMVVPRKAMAGCSAVVLRGAMAK